MQQGVSIHTFYYPKYLHCQQAMRLKAKEIANTKKHEIWLVNHDSIFTLGQATNRDHLLDTGDIPVVQSNRGGQVSWHGPGQIIIYTLFYLPYLKINVRQLVSILESSVVNLLAECGIHANARAYAPGVYVDDKKIASVGLRISRGVSYHGLSFNHDCSLEAFNRINTCGYPDLEVTRLIDLYDNINIDKISLRLCYNIADEAGLTINHKDQNTYERN